MSAKPLAVLLLLAGLLAASDRLTSRPRPVEKDASALAVEDTLTTAAGEQRLVRLPDRSRLFVRENTTLTVKGASTIDLAAGEVFVETAAGKLAPTVLVKTPKREFRGQESRFGVRANDTGSSLVVATGQVRVSGIDQPVRSGQQLEAKADKPTGTRRIAHQIAWTRELRSAAPLVPPSEHAGGTLVVRDPDGQERQLELREYRVDVHIEDGFARTTIDQTFFNSSESRLEGTFRFPLPADASLSRLAMYVEGTLMEGGMAERDHARAVYERILRSMRDPALLEWVDGTTFKMRVFPLEPRQEKRIVLSYAQRLPALYDRTSYRFPAGHSLTQVKKWSFHATVKNAGTLNWSSPTHPGMTARREDSGDLILDASAEKVQADRDVALELFDKGDAGGERVRWNAASQDGARYVMLRYRPSLPAAPRRERRDWLFLVETSADRDPLIARAQIELVRAILKNAEHDDTINVLTAGTVARPFAPKAVSATSDHVAAAVEFLERAQLIGALDLGAAFDAARPLLEGGVNPHLVHVGGGQAALGETRTEHLLDRLPPGVRYV